MHSLTGSLAGPVFFVFQKCCSRRVCPEDWYQFVSFRCHTSSVPVASHTSKGLLWSPRGTKRLVNEVVVGKKNDDCRSYLWQGWVRRHVNTKGHFQHITVTRVSFAQCWRSHRPVQAAPCCSMSRGHLAGPASNDPRSCSPPSERRPSCPGPQQAVSRRRNRPQETSPYLPWDCPCRLRRA